MSNMEPKQFGALLTGAMKRVFYGEEQVTVPLLKEKVFPDSDISMQELGGLFNNCCGFLRQAGLDDWTPARVENVLSKSKFTEMQREVMKRFWDVNKVKIHALLTERSELAPRLRSFKWRVDVTAKTRHNPDLHTPSAIVEMVVGHHSEDPNDLSDCNVVQFEMGAEQLKSVLGQIATIQDVLNSKSSS